MQEPKFRLMPETQKRVIISSDNFYRIQYLKDIELPYVNRVVKAGEIGGWVQNVDTLHQEGSCVILDDAIAWDVHVVDNVVLQDDAKVSGGAFICGNAHLHGRCVIKGSIWIGDDVEVADNAVMRGSGLLSQRAKLLDDCVIQGRSFIKGRAQIYQNAMVSNSHITDSHVFGETEISDLVLEGGFHRVNPLVIKASKHDISLQRTGVIQVGCSSMSFKEWHDKGRQLAKEQRLTKQQIKEYSAHIRYIIKMSEYYNLERPLVDEVDSRRI